MVQHRPLRTPVGPSAELVEHRWRRVEDLGAGGFGTVYLRTCKPKFSRRLFRAVKQLSKPRGRNVLDVKDFARELNAATSLSKPEVSAPEGLILSLFACRMLTDTRRL